MSSRLFVATRKGLFRLERGRAGWAIASASFLGENLSLVLPDARDGALYGALDLGHFGVKLWVSKNIGETWEEISAPAYPPVPEGHVEKLADGRDWPLRVERIWALEAGLTSEPGLLYAGTIPGGLFISRDSGKQWELARGLWDHPSRKEWFGGGADYPGIHSVIVGPSGALTIGVSCGGVWRSPDGGTTWELRGKGLYAEFMPPERREDLAIQDPHRVVACPASPEHLWVQHHNGVFRSTDGGLTFQDIKSVVPSTFGFAVAVHPRDPNIAWTVPAERDAKRIPVGGKVVVAKTRDGGATWTAEGKGLPQEHAYDIVFRHALDVDETGDTLAFGSTTGALWISEDGGESWQTISTHLPPVHAVRFAQGAAGA